MWVQIEFAETSLLIECTFILIANGHESGLSLKNNRKLLRQKKKKKKLIIVWGTFGQYWYHYAGKETNKSIFII